MGLVDRLNGLVRPVAVLPSSVGSLGPREDAAASVGPRLPDSDVELKKVQKERHATRPMQRLELDIVCVLVPYPPHRAISRSPFRTAVHCTLRLLNGSSGSHDLGSKASSFIRHPRPRPLRPLLPSLHSCFVSSYSLAPHHPYSSSSCCRPLQTSSPHPYSPCPRRP